MLNPLPPPTLSLPGKVASAGRTSTTSIISISNPTATNAPAVAASAPKWLVLTIFFPFYSPRAGRSDLPRCRSLWRFCLWERIATPRPCEGPSPPRRPLLGDVYAHEVHRTVERIVERVRLFGPHQDVGRVGDRAGRARLGGAALSVHPRHHRSARLYALQRMPVSVHDVARRYFVHCAPVSLEEAVQLADGGVGPPLYLHLVVAAFGRNKALAHDVVAVVVQRLTVHQDGGRKRDVLPLGVEAVGVGHEHVGRRAVEAVGRPNLVYVRRGTVIVVAGPIEHLPVGVVHLPFCPLQQHRPHRRSHRSHYRRHYDRRCKHPPHRYILHLSSPPIRASSGTRQPAQLNKVA